MYSCHLFLIYSASVRSIPFLSFIVPIFGGSVPLVSLISLKSSLVFQTLLFSSISFFFFFFSSTSLLLPTHLPPPSCTHAQSCNPMDFSPPDSSVHGFFQARILEWVAISFCFPLFLCTDHCGRLSYLSLLFFGTLHSNGYIFPLPFNLGQFRRIISILVAF